MYFVYILKCSDDSLYTGIAKDLEKRLKEHNNSELAAKYTRSRRPVQLVFSKEFETRSLALKEEACIKKLSKQEKLKIINFNAISDKKI